MKMILLKMPYAPERYQYHLAFQKEGKSAFDLNQQFSRDNDKKEPRKGIIGIINGARSLKPIMNKLSEWLNKYDNLVMGSHNEKLTQKWLSNLEVATRYFPVSFTIHKESLMGHDAYIISKK